MSNVFYGAGLDALGRREVDLLNDVIRATLIDLSEYALAVDGATNATPIEVTTSDPHGLTSGDEVMLSGVGGNADANNDPVNPRWAVTVTSTTSFTLQHPVTGADVAGSGTYTSGGFVVKLSRDAVYDDIPALARVATATLTSKTLANGIFDAADTTFTLVSGAECEAVVLDCNTGNDATSPLLGIVTDAGSLPVTPSGGDILLTWDNTYHKICRL